MVKKVKKEVEKNICKCHYYKGGSSGAIYGLGFIGALVYYISTASGFWVGVLGFLKALVWPAFVVYDFLRLFGLVM